MDSLLTWKGVPLAIAFPSSLHRRCQQGKWSTELSAEILSESIGLDQLKKILSAGCRQVVTAPKSKNKSQFLHFSRCSAFDSMDSTRLDVKSDQCTGNRKAQVSLVSLIVCLS